MHLVQLHREEIEGRKEYVQVEEIPTDDRFHLRETEMLCVIAPSNVVLVQCLLIDA